MCSLVCPYLTLLYPPFLPADWGAANSFYIEYRYTLIQHAVSSSHGPLAWVLGTLDIRASPVGTAAAPVLTRWLSAS
jgi:hypothetical protein